jgi:hypothetical protein
MAHRILVLYGSYRTDRMGIRLARYVVRELNDLGADAALIDAKAINLPMLDRMYKEYPVGEAPPALEKLAERIRTAHAFVFVTGEYNWGVQPGLKNLTDHFLEEWVLAARGNSELFRRSLRWRPGRPLLARDDFRNGDGPYFQLARSRAHRQGFGCRCAARRGKWSRPRRVLSAIRCRSSLVGPKQPGCSDRMQARPTDPDQYPDRVFQYIGG